MTTITTITATARNYTATLDCATGRVSIADDNNVWVGDGQWNGNAIVGRPAVLGGSLDTSDEIYDELASALSEAVAGRRARAEYLSLFSSLAEAVEYENQILAIGDDLLPECARDVRDGTSDNEPRAEYWEWLRGQVEDVPAVEDAAV